MAHNKVRSADLCSQLNVSEDTVRRDLKELAERGIIRKVHGGAVANSLIPPGFREQNIYQSEEKRIIARKALSLLEGKRTILIDGSTTNLEFARHFPASLQATVFTNSIPIAYELCNHANLDLVLLGGRVLKQARVAAGLDVLQFLEDVHADICFLGTRSLHAGLGITTNRREEALVKRKLAESSVEVAALATSDKVGTIQPFKVLGLEQLHILVTELDPGHPAVLPFAKKGLRVF